MKLALVGLPGSGKTTLLNALTGAHKATCQFDQKANLVEIPLPDPRLDHLSRFYKPAKTTPATVRFSDLPGITPGEGQGERLSMVREADALLVVLRAFDTPAYPHPLGSIDPGRDRRELEGELALWDLAVLEKRRDRLRANQGKPRFTPEDAVELPVQERACAWIEEQQTLRGFPLAPDERKLLRSFAPVTLLPQLLVVNQDEGDLARRWIEEQPGGPPVLSLSARLEAELLDLEESERATFMAEMGLAHLSRDRVLRRSYEALGLETFFTVGEDEVRAWTLAVGGNAVDAAGTIHTDLARGFIRAEVVSYADFERYGSIPKAREAGRFRLEGKEYPVQDGDILTIRFSV